MTSAVGAGEFHGEGGRRRPVQRPTRAVRALIFSLERFGHGEINNSRLHLTLYNLCQLPGSSLAPRRFKLAVLSRD